MTEALVPNLFDHARSELTQDAVLTYLLRWAKPGYSGPLHDLGADLLAELLRAVGWRVESDLVPAALRVETQVRGIDVLVALGGGRYLIIEDKTGTGEHGGQIARYRKGQEKQDECVAARVVYLKTGNEARGRRPEGADGWFFRPDLLRVLGRHLGTGNAIVEEFRSHLEAMEADTASFRRVPPSEWGWLAWEGFFQEVESWFGGPDQRPGWGYVANATGGFLGCWWPGLPAARLGCDLYLQIDAYPRGQDDPPQPAPLLAFRASGAWAEDDTQAKVSSQTLWHAWEALEELAAKPAGLPFTIGKAGRFRSGCTASFAELSFADGGSGFVATGEDGFYDPDRTRARLQQALGGLTQLAGSLH